MNVYLHLNDRLDRTAILHVYETLAGCHHYTSYPHSHPFEEFVVPNHHDLRRSRVDVHLEPCNMNEERNMGLGTIGRTDLSSTFTTSILSPFLVAEVQITSYDTLIKFGATYETHSIDCFLVQVIFHEAKATRGSSNEWSEQRQ